MMMMLVKAKMTKDRKKYKRNEFDDDDDERADRFIAHQTIFFLRTFKVR